jgi:hypothetical protein
MALKQHNSWAVIIWTGGDANDMRWGSRGMLPCVFLCLMSAHYLHEQSPTRLLGSGANHALSVYPFQISLHARWTVMALSICAFLSTRSTIRCLLPYRMATQCTSTGQPTIMVHNYRLYETHLVADVSKAGLEYVVKNVVPHISDIPIIYAKHRAYHLAKTHLNVSFHVFDTTEALISHAYKHAFIGLRLTTHDGLAASVQEMGLMGRR